MKWAAWLIAALGLGIVAYGTLMRRIDPPKVIREGKIDIADPKDGGKGGGSKVSFRTRTVQGGGIVTEQVELPGGTWIDCGGDCRDAVRKATTDFWEEQRKK
jgi:hypothetical protein